MGLVTYVSDQVSLGVFDWNDSDIDPLEDNDVDVGEGSMERPNSPQYKRKRTYSETFSDNKPWWVIINIYLYNVHMGPWKQQDKKTILNFLNGFKGTLHLLREMYV